MPLGIEVMAGSKVQVGSGSLWSCISDPPWIPNWREWICGALGDATFVLGIALLVLVGWRLLKRAQRPADTANQGSVITLGPKTTGIILVAMFVVAAALTSMARELVFRSCACL